MTAVNFMSSVSVAVAIAATTLAFAQATGGDFLDCLRFVQSQERNLRIPQDISPSGP